MRITLPYDRYTQINTDDTEFLIQNIGDYDMHIVVTKDDPGAKAEPDFILEPGEGIGNKHVVGICWGKSASKPSTTAGIV